MCNCQGKTYNIAMCCEPQIKLGPIENYYTKPATDRRIQEEISGISAVTIDEVQEMIDEAVSGITVSGVTEEQMNEAIASAKTEIEAEIPSLDGYATEQWVEDKHYITGVDLSDYSTTEQMNNAITAATDGLATTAYVNTQISSQTSDFVTGEELSSYTYDKTTIDDKIASGGGKTISAGRGISITTGETADTVSVSLPISAGTGVDSIAEGYATTASGMYGAHAEGWNTVASGMYGAHAEGWNAVANGMASHAEGYQTTASTFASHAEGQNTTASGSASHAEGSYTVANNESEHASGRYNVSSSGSSTFGDSGNTLFSIGNGTSDNARHNVFEIRQNADIYITSGGTDILLQNNLASSTEKATWNSKPNVWCGDETAWGQISGGTLDPQCIYLVY